MQAFNEVVLFVAVTLKGAQPAWLLKLNDGLGGVVMQTVFTILSILQDVPTIELFLTISFTLYIPATLNLTPSAEEPQVEGLFVGLVLPRLPFTIDHPLEGVITQLEMLFASHTPLFCTTTPAIDVLEKVTVLLIQAIESGEIAKPAAGRVMVVIGSTAPSKKPHGFCARILTKKVLGVIPPAAPQDELLKLCTNEGGGGWANTMLGDPSLKETVYVVPGGLLDVLLIKKVSTAGIHCKIVEPLDDKPIPGFDPLYTVYLLIALQPFEPVTV